ncbi:MAG: hypothetical protein MJY67_04105 [Bacteroidales bacterium]|nr:hypothetical protein [Bacteroidales bacterium]
MKISIATILLSLATLVFSTEVKAQESIPEASEKKMKYSGFAGGMMIHCGYAWGGSFDYLSADGASTIGSEHMRGVPYGIGGAMKVGLGKHLRVGAEGYVSTLHYGKRLNHRSYATTGWGGVLADCIWTKERWSWFIGATIGGGSVKNISMLENTPLDYKVENGSVSFRRYGFMAVSPYIGFEYALTPKVHLTSKVDCLVNVTGREKDFAIGPRVYFGFMFCHGRSH